MPAQGSHMMPGNGRRSAPAAVLQSPPCNLHVCAGVLVQQSVESLTLLVTVLRSGQCSDALAWSGCRHCSIL